MQKKLLYLLIVFCGHFSYAQLTCPTLTGPMDGDVNVPVDAEIAWTEVTGVNSYIINLGTTQGGTDIIDNGGVGNVTTYQPPFGLPENTEVYVTIVLFLFDAPDIICEVGSFRTEDVTTPPSCTTLQSPLDGATNIDVRTRISWEYVTGATDYRVIIGTTPGGDEIVDTTVNRFLLYDPITDLPFDTEIFVRIIPSNENGTAPGICPTYSFTTNTVSEIPTCATLVNPTNGAINVPLTSTLQWTDVPEASGYRVFIGTSPNSNDILDNSIYQTNAIELLDFLPRRTYFVRIIPFNDGGDAIDCIQESFSTILGCDPFISSVTGELTTLSPEIVFPDKVPLCINEGTSTISANNPADGYRWFKRNADGGETLISESEQITLSESGDYRLEIYDLITEFESDFECSTSKDFEVVPSEIPDITSLNVTEQGDGFSIDIAVDGAGNYEFSLDAEGPYQDSSFFTNLSGGPYTVFVRDRNGCGMAERIFGELSLEDFPKFFTPNGDGINDFWQYDPQILIEEINLETIYIFNRLGNLLTVVDPRSQGWDGNLNGVPLPASDYWFRARSEDNKEVKGHFSLKR